MQLSENDTPDRVLVDLNPNLTNRTVQIWIQCRFGRDVAGAKKLWCPDPRTWHTGSVAEFTRS